MSLSRQIDDSDRRLCPLSRKDSKMKRGRRCSVDNKPCYTPWMWLYKVCDMAKKHRDTLQQFF